MAKCNSFSGSISSASLDPLLSLGILPKTREAEKRDPRNEVGPNDGKKVSVSHRRSTQVHARPGQTLVFRTDMLIWIGNVLNPRQTGRGNEWLVESQYHRSLLDRR